MNVSTLEQTSLASLNGVGPKTRERLQRIGVNNAQDLLFHLPLRYEDRTKLTPIGQLKPNTTALFEGTIKAAGIVPGRRRSFVCKLEQDFAIVSIRLFHFSAAQTRGLIVGARLRCFGEMRFGRNSLECFHPEYKLIPDGEELAMETELSPVYPSTEGLHQASFRKLIGQVLPMLTSHLVTELLPRDFIQKYQHTAGDTRPTTAHSTLFDNDLADALRVLHAPTEQELKHLTQYQQRLAFEELLAHHLSLLLMRARIQQFKAPRMTRDSKAESQFLALLGFSLTGAQQSVGDQIASDLANTLPTLRLVQGDVGCGKTVVAAIAALQAISNGYQVALMAPTEILTEQHSRAFNNWFQPLGISVSLLSGQQTAKQKRESLAAIADGSARMVVGTHALIQEAVEYNKLGLIIIDEQHRFGVDQRLSLRRKAMQSGVCPHQLIMTATPIPRTLAMAAYADLDVSVINELPPGRTPVTTTVLDNSHRARVVERVRRACLEGRQAYWVCTLVEESEALQCQAAEKAAEELQHVLQGMRVGLVHGKLKSADKAAVMTEFSRGEIQLLVATTVIEVGVDVPNASLMIIENSERLGLSQIHQLRGRVGRGPTESHCLLMYQKPLANIGKQRLETLRKSTDGFYIAEQDLALRGPGEVLGTRQTGMLQFRIADLERDEELLEQVHEIGEQFLIDCEPLVQPLINRWIGERSAYGDA